MSSQAKKSRSRLGHALKPAWADQSGFINGEPVSNPLQGPPDLGTADEYHRGGIARERLRSLDGSEHTIGAERARRPFNRGVPS